MDTVLKSCIQVVSTPKARIFKGLEPTGYMDAMDTAQVTGKSKKRANAEKLALVKKVGFYNDNHCIHCVHVSTFHIVLLSQRFQGFSAGYKVDTAIKIASTLYPLVIINLISFRHCVYYHRGNCYD